MPHNPPHQPPHPPPPPPPTNPAPTPPRPNPPPPTLFHVPISFVPAAALAGAGVPPDQVLRQARQAADGYLKGSRAWDRRLGRFAGLAGPFWGAAGALLASGVWCAWLFL